MLLWSAAKLENVLLIMLKQLVRSLKFGVIASLPVSRRRVTSLATSEFFSTSLKQQLLSEYLVKASLA